MLLRVIHLPCRAVGRRDVMEDVVPELPYTKAIMETGTLFESSQIKVEVISTEFRTCSHCKLVLQGVHNFPNDKM